MNINSPFPDDIDLLIEALDEIFPDRAPNPNDHDREIWMKAGEVRAVTFLKAWRKAFLEKQPYVRRQNAKGQHGSRAREAGTSVHQPVLHKPRSRRGRRKGGPKQPSN